METENSDSTTKTLSCQGGVIWRISLFFVIPVTVILFVICVLSLIPCWIIWGDSQIFAYQVAKFYKWWLP